MPALNARDLRRKIKSIGNIKKITRAMQMVSASKLKKVQERLMQLRPYSDKIALFVEGLAAQLKELRYPLAQPRGQVQRVGIVLVMADKGLCGSYNSNMSLLSDRFISDLGKPVELTVRTIPAPDDKRRPVIGIRIAQAADIDLPVDVDIDLGDVGGPSAGLPFALQVLQELGRDIDRGYRVAATGEIELDGTVAPIGGMKQKALGVRMAGADVFLVPAGDNESVARRYAGNLRVIGVENFQQALRALATLSRK